MITTVKLRDTTKTELDLFREYKNESYEEVIQKLIFIAKNAEKQPDISQQTAKDIQKARERIKKGLYLTEENARRRLGL
ncbi:hypothetical protein COV13_02890 [Candidatus Woesearchaeota archaeon CG10_big_fil_rev_8_21_14_0_10_32_9]|nr:MAG: hypothetical protein COV13_02890 [Candidatus Woesearchaeota archaeon CG10_big_fil_rev_8_21_14_0_10_32_9]